MRILILSRTDDIHAVQVAQHLKEGGHTVEFFRLEQFVPAAIQFSVGESRDQQNIFDASSDLRNLDRMDSIWHRRPGRFVSNSLPEPWMARMVESEARAAMYGMFQCLNRPLWINHPDADLTSGYKLYQLQVAESCGLRVPPSLVTNDPDAVREFYERCNGEVIYKMLTEQTHMYIPTYEAPQGVPTLPLRKADLKYLEQVRKSPHFFQKHLSKRYDLRVTVVGKKFFPVKIDSQSGVGKLDWRHDYSVDMQPEKLPSEITDSCMRLMHKLQLNYGSIDLCVDTSGDYYFFEVNSAGQYFWMEDRLKLPISFEIAQLLSHRTEPVARYFREI